MMRSGKLGSLRYRARNIIAEESEEKRRSRLLYFRGWRSYSDTNETAHLI